MKAKLRLLAVVVATVAGAGLASCSSDSPTESTLDQVLVGSRGAGGDSAGGDSIPDDTIPNDTIPNDTIPTDTIPNDTIPNDTIPNDTIPNDTIPNDTIPNDTIPNDTIPNDTIPNDTIPNDTIPNDTLVSHFDLTVTVVGADSSEDTLTTIRLSGARVTVHRYPSTPDSSRAPNAVFKVGRTDQNGQIRFRGLPSAWYRIEVDPPPRSPYLESAALVAPPTSIHVPLQVLLPRKP